MSNPVQTVQNVFETRGRENYGTEAVTQLQHALQCAQLAEDAKASPPLITAALLHDIGHILSDDQLPTSLGEDLNDYHEERGYQWVLNHFGAAVADPVRLHVAAKRYLCTIDPGYAQTLSPTSYKSFQDQGGTMREDEKTAFEDEPFYQEALDLRRWDDQAKDPSQKTASLAHFLGYVQESLKAGAS